MSKFNASTVRKIAALVDDNYHGQAKLVGARMLGLTKLARKFELMLKLQDLEGCLHPHLREYDYDLYKQLMEQAKLELTPKEYERFYAAF